MLHDGTILFVLALIALVNGVVIGWAASMARHAVGAWHWSLASLLLAISAASVLLPTSADGALRPLLFNIPATASYALWLAGALRFCNRSTHDVALLALFCALVACSVYWSAVAPDREVRVAVAASGAALLRVVTAAVLWQHGERDDTRRVARAAALSLLVDAILLLWHVGNAIRGEVSAAGTGGPYAANPTWLGMLTTAVVTTPLLILLGLSRLLAELRRAADHDSLTGLLNRRGFFAVIRPLLAHGRRSSNMSTVLLLDIDHFKQINDRHGHAAGDRVLRTMGQTLRDCLREADVAVRWGGEEFCVLLIGTDPEGIGTVCGRIRSTFTAACHCLPELDGRTVTVSIGACSGETASLGFDTLQQRADGALYAAKAAGRDRLVVAAPLEAVAS